MATECVRCGQWLSGGDVLQGYCWNCKRTLSEGEIEMGLSPTGEPLDDEEADDG